MSLIAELRRRNVIRVAGFYLVAAWLIVQVAETVLPAFDVPGWVLRALIIVLALGFLPALVFSWVFELTPEGLKRESEIDRSQSVVDRTARKLDIAVIVMLAVVGGMLLWRDKPPSRSDTEAMPTDSGREVASSPSFEPVVDKTIAVLPFADFSPEGDQAWFADGLSEEILNALTRTPDLRVSARTSSFRYKGSALSIPQIAAELGVAHVLEGSVRSTPQRIRVTAQLIRAADGFHLWSQHYDREVADMIAIQEDLAQQIARAMQTSMDPAALAAMAQVGTRSVEAYQHYLRGLSLGLQSPEVVEEAYQAFERARALDPGFAAAHAAAATYWFNQLDVTGFFYELTALSPAQIGQQFTERIDAAIASAATPGDRSGYQALEANRELRLRDAAALFRTYLAERPGDSAAWLQLLSAESLLRDRDALDASLDSVWPDVGRHREMAIAHINNAHRGSDRARAAEQALAIIEQRPDDYDLMYQAHRALLWGGRIEAARAMLARMDGHRNASPLWGRLPSIRQACAEGNRAEAERIAAGENRDNPSIEWHLLMLLGRTDEATSRLMPLEQSGNTFALASFLTYPHFDPRPFPSLRRLIERERIERVDPEPLPFACPPAQTPS